MRVEVNAYRRIQAHSGTGGWLPSTSEIRILCTHISFSETMADIVFLLGGRSCMISMLAIEHRNLLALKILIYPRSVISTA